MKRILKIVLFVVFIIIEIIIIAIMYDNWFDTLDMIKTEPNFNAESYYERVSKKRENIIFYGSIIIFIVLNYFYLRKVFLTKNELI